MSRLMMMGCGSSGPGAISTFYSQRVFDLFPQMATANSGWSTHAAEGNNVFGSDIRTDNTNDSDYIEWTVYVPAGNYKVCAQHTKTNATGRADLAIDGGAVVDTLDTYNGSAAYNQKWTSAQFTVTEGLHTIRLTKNGKNASSSGYIIALTHCQLIKQDATSALASVANAPHVIEVPVVLADSHTNFNTLSINADRMFGIALVSSGAQNATVTLSFWAPKGNATLAILHFVHTIYGIAAISVDGASWGSVDFYNAGGSAGNILNTSITGTLSTTGMHTITLLMSTKNASSSSYYAAIQHIQIRMTSITEPLAADLAPEVTLFWPWLPDAATDWVGANVNAAQAYYNNSVGVFLNSLIDFNNIVLLKGTYTFALLVYKNSDSGKCHVILDGADVGSVDIYNAGTLANQSLALTSITVATTGLHTVEFKMVDKNASSSGYVCRLTLARAIRTGA